MNDIYVGALFSDSYLEHHGIKGMRWGVRRYQNEDGSLTEAGRKKYGKKLARELNKEDSRRVHALTRAEHSRRVYSDRAGSHNKLVDKIGAKAQKHPERMGRYQKKLSKSLQKTAKAAKWVDKDLAETSNHEKRMNELMKDAEKNGIKLDKKMVSRAGHFDGVNQYYAQGVKFSPSKDKSAKSNGKKLAIAAAAAVGVGLAAYGAYKLHDSRTPKLVNTGESKTKELFGATFKPTTFQPTTFKPATFQPTTFKPTTFQPTTVEPTRIDIPRASVPRTDVPRTSIPRTEVERTDIPRVSFKDMTIDDLKKMNLW